MMERAEILAEMLDLRRRFDEDPIKGVRHRLYALQRIYEVFTRNRSALNSLLGQMDDPATWLPIIDATTPASIDEFIGAVEQSLFNFLASASSLIDHTRRHVRAYKGTGTGEQYQRGVEARFATWDVAQVVNGLRDFALHRELPIARTTMSAQREDASAAFMVRVDIVLQTGQLLEWQKWKPNARALLEANPGEISIRWLTTAYGERVVEFYDWFAQFQALHDIEGLAELDRVAGRLDVLEALLDPIQEPSPEDHLSEPS